MSPSIRRNRSPVSGSPARVRLSSTDASALKSLNPAREVSSQETHEGHLIRNGFTGEAYSDQMVLLHLVEG